MARLPTVQHDMMFPNTASGAVPVESAAWFAWLRTATSFTYKSSGGTYTARREERSGSQFWYAYRRMAGVLRKAYLGRSAELSVERLEQAARTLAELAGVPAHTAKSSW